jgi:hypothetical protein
MDKKPISFVWLLFCAVPLLGMLWAVTQRSYAAPAGFPDMLPGFVALGSAALSLICLIISLIYLAGTKGNSSAKAYAIGCVLVAATPLVLFGIGLAAQKKPVAEPEQLFVDYAWNINHHLVRYHEQFPERFHYTGTDDEVQVEGFADFAASHIQSIHLTVKQGRILDPWGAPLSFVLARDGQPLIRMYGREFPIHPVVGMKTPVIVTGIATRHDSHTYVNTDGGVK